MAVGGRRRVLEQVREKRPAVFALVAPPGFEKHEIAYMYARSFDCVLELDDAPAKDFSFGEGQCVIVPSTVTDDPERLRLILARTTAALREGNGIVVCCDREPPFSFVEFARPTETIVLRRADLALDLADMRELCDRPSRAYELLNSSQGWPFIARYLAEHRGIGLAELMDWLDITIVRGLDPATLRGLFEIVARMDAKADDLPSEVVTELCQSLQLVDVGVTGELRPLRFIRDFVYARKKRELLEAAYRVVESDAKSNPVRAARALVNVGEIRAAENLLRSVDAVAVASLGGYPYPVSSIELGDTIPPPYYLYPRVWFGLVGARSFTRSPQLLADEARTILSFDAVDDDIRPYILWTAAVWSARGGHVGEAIELSEAFSQQYVAEYPALVDLAFLFNDVILGDAQRVDERWHASGRALLPFPTLYALGARLVVRAFLARGDAEKGRELLRLTLTLARAGGSPFLAASAATEAAYISWLLGDHDDFRRKRDEAIAMIRGYDAVAYWAPVAAMSGDDVTDAFPCDPLWEARSFAMLAATNAESEAVHFARRAIAAAERARTLSCLYLTYAIAMFRDPEHAASHEKRLRELLETAGAPAVKAAVHTLLGNDAAQESPFTALLQRVAASITARDAEPVLVVDLARGTVTAPSAVSVSDGTLALLACIAVHGGSVKRDVLLRYLWPQVDALSAQSALKMCVHRARLQLDDPAAIIVSKGMYAFGPRIRSNYADVTDAAARTYSNPLSSADRERLCLLFDALVSGGDWSASWLWFAPFQRHLHDAALRFGELLARDALARGEVQRALHSTRAMLSVRPLDELSRLLAIEIYLASNDRAGAMREYREHEALVRSKLGVEPSARMRQLVSTA